MTIFDGINHFLQSAFLLHKVTKYALYMYPNKGPQSLSLISNLVLTDRKKAINIKIIVNPVNGRWEI